jgi:hypothetical protein
LIDLLVSLLQEWFTPAACYECLSTDIGSFASPCVDHKQTISYLKKNNCNGPLPPSKEQYCSYVVHFDSSSTQPVSSVSKKTKSGIRFVSLLDDLFITFDTAEASLRQLF